MKPTFWKLSQGAELFSYEEILDSIESRLVYVHKDTDAKGISKTPQATDFINAKNGDYFYLTHGNTGIFLLGQFTGATNLFSTYGEGWLDRPFRFIKSSITRKKYDGEQKWWTPNDNSTFVKVPDGEIVQFEQEILKPFFDIELKKFGIKTN